MRKLVFGLLIPLAAFAQDTTRLEPIATILASKVLYHDATRLVVTASQWSYDYDEDSILVYDITEPYRPRLIDRAIPIVTRSPGVGDFVLAEHSDAVLFDDLVVSPIIRQARYGDFFPDVMFTLGPIELCGESFDGFSSWRILIQDIIEWDGNDENPPYYHLPGEIERYGDYLFFAAGSWGLRIYDLTDRLHPELIDTLDYVVDWIERDEDLMIIGSYNEIIGLDVSDPAHPIQTWLYGRDEMPFTPLAFHAGYFYGWNRSEDSTEFVVLDLSEGGEPVVVGRFGIEELYRDLRYDQFIIEDGRLYARDNDLITVYSLEDPLNPIVWKRVFLPLNYHMLAIAGRLMISQSEDPLYNEFPTAYLYDALENGVEDSDPAAHHPLSLMLHPAFPNPFNSSTTITYDVALPGFIRLGVYDIEGRLVGSIKDRYALPGRHREVWDGAGISSGEYFLQLRQNGVAYSVPIIFQK